MRTCLFALVICVASARAEIRIEEEVSARVRAERKVEIYAIIATITVCIVLIGLSESLISLLNVFHQHRAGLQLALGALLALFTVGVFHPKWRKWCWGGGAFAILLVIIQLVG